MQRWLRDRVKTIAGTDGGIVVHLDSGISLYYGDASAAPAKARAAAAVLRWAARADKQLVSIDVSAPLAPTAQLPYTPPVPAPIPSPSPEGKKSNAGTKPSPSPSASPQTKTGAAKRRARRGSGN